MVTEIYAALDDGNPRAVASHLGREILGDAGTLDMLCRPFTYRAHYIERIVERPRQRFEVFVRILFKPMEEHAYVLTFAWTGDRFFLEDAKGSWKETFLGELRYEDPRLEADEEAAKEVVRKFVYAAMAGKNDVLHDLMSPRFPLRDFVSSEAMQALQGVNSVSSLTVGLQSDRGLKFRVRVGTDHRGFAYGPKGRILAEHLDSRVRIVAMKWEWGRVMFEGEDPHLETYTLRRFGLAAPAASASTPESRPSATGEHRVGESDARDGAPVPPPAAPASRTIATHRFRVLEPKGIWGAWGWRTQTIEVTDAGVLIDDGRSGARNQVRLSYTRIVSCAVNRPLQSMEFKTVPGSDDEKPFYVLSATIDQGQEQEFARRQAVCDQIMSAREARLASNQR